MEITTFELFEIAQELETRSSLFRQFWDIGKPKIVDNSSPIKTACITFDEVGNAISFIFNFEFWSSLDLYSRSFVTSHEMLHILLNHGKRMIALADDSNANKAMDIVVNHLLINDMGFDRTKLSFDWTEYCWVDTLFTGSDIPPSTKSFEYYYSLLKNTKTPDLSCIDFHGISENGEGDYYKLCDTLSTYIKGQDIDDKLKNIIKNFGEPASHKYPGTGIGAWIDINGINIKPPLKKWEKIIKPKKKKLIYDFNTINTWIRDNKRLSSFIEENPIFLETESYVEGYYTDIKFTQIWFFLDTSNSCIEYKYKFLDISKTLSKHKFLVDLFTFDTVAKPVPPDLKRIHGGGGTSFKCIEDFIQSKCILDGLPYPDSVFVITDGYSSTLANPEHPNRWHWFLTSDSNSQFMAENIHKLSDYE